MRKWTGDWYEFRASDATEAMRIFRQTYPDSARIVGWTQLSVRDHDGQWVSAHNLPVDLGGYSEAHLANDHALRMLSEVLDKTEQAYREADQDTVPAEVLSHLRVGLDTLRRAIWAEQFDADTTMAAISVGVQRALVLSM